LEDKMNITTKISAAVAVAAISAAFIGFSSSANAAASLRETCHGSTRNAVERCCESWVRRNGKPMWMLVDAHAGCHNATSCRGGGKSTLPGIAYVKMPKCYIDQTPPDIKGSPNNPPPPTRGGLTNGFN
jgi:hypothetical protein